MKAESADGAQLAAVVEALRKEVAALGERLAALEAKAGAPAQATRPNAAPPASRPIAHEVSPAARGAAAEAKVEAATKTESEGLSEELVAVIAAAVAAFLGKRAHVRQIRLLGSPAWSEQGRVTIQASHRLEHRGS